MIDRLVTTLAAIVALPALDATDADTRRLLDDCADALRLELDCPQQSLTAEQRSELRELSELLDAESGESGRIASAARRSARALGIAARRTDGDGQVG